MDYNKVWELVKEDISYRDIPKKSFVWLDYLNSFSDFMWQIEHDTSCKGYDNEQDLAEYIVDTLVENYTWDIMEQSLLGIK